MSTQLQLPAHTRDKFLAEAITAIWQEVLAQRGRTQAIEGKMDQVVQRLEELRLMLQHVMPHASC